MKFFTMDWWRGVQCLVFDDPTPLFQSHLASIRDRLPPDLLLLQESISLHDANILQINYQRVPDVLEVLLNGDDGTGGLRNFQLRYSTIFSFRTIVDTENGLPGPCGYGDLGYDEADVTDDGRFEHRMLFSTGIEIQIVFGGFKVEWQDAD